MTSPRSQPVLLPVLAMAVTVVVASLTGCVPESKKATTPVRHIEEVKIHVGPPQAEQDQKTEQGNEE